MEFEDFIKEGKVNIGQPDIQKARALIKMSENSIKTADSLKIDNVNSSIVLMISYESLREILEAMCLSKGFKVYSHEAYVYYVKKMNETSSSEKFDRFRKLRNGCNYYGKSVSAAVANNAREEIKNLRISLIKKYLDKI